MIVMYSDESISEFVAEEPFNRECILAHRKKCEKLYRKSGSVLYSESNEINMFFIFLKNKLCSIDSK